MQPRSWKCSSEAWNGGGNARIPASHPKFPNTYPVDPMLGWSYPENGLVLKITVRDLPRNSGDVDPRHNIDFAWFTEEETGSLVPENAGHGQTFRAPDFFTRRLALNQFIDTARGQSHWMEG